MAVTNAISGTTALGGGAIMGGGILPSTSGEMLGAAAVTLSAVNIFGGFMVSKKMLDLFSRPEDPPEFYSLYAVRASARRRSSLAARRLVASCWEAPVVVRLEPCGLLALVRLRSRWGLARWTRGRQTWCFVRFVRLFVLSSFRRSSSPLAGARDAACRHRRGGRAAPTTNRA